MSDRHAHSQLFFETEKMPNFYIGRQRNGFLYTRTHFTANGSPVCKCARGSDLNDDTKIYYLFKQTDGCWIAIETSATAADPVNDPEATRQFWTVSQVVEQIQTNDLELRWEQWNTEATPPRWDWEQTHWVTFAAQA